MRKRRNTLKNGVLVIGLGIGLMLACFLPIKFLVGLLAVLVVLLGVILSRSC